MAAGVIEGLEINDIIPILRKVQRMDQEGAVLLVWDRKSRTWSVTAGDLSTVVSQ